MRYLRMRKRPVDQKKEQDFVERVITHKDEEINTKEDFHKYVRKSKWPVFDDIISPSMADGSNLRKPMSLPIKEFEWNSIDRHTKTIGVNKSEWLRYAILRLIQDEQLFFMKNKNE